MLNWWTEGQEVWGSKLCTNLVEAHYHKLKEEKEKKSPDFHLGQIDFLLSHQSSSCKICNNHML